MDVVLGVVGVGVAVVSAVLAWLQWQRPRPAPAPVLSKGPAGAVSGRESQVVREDTPGTLGRGGFLTAVVTKRIGPFVGRASELAVLAREWEGVCAGGSGVVLITGEAGIGKSELVYEFTSSIRDSGNTLASRPSLSRIRSHALVKDLCRQAMDLEDDQFLFGLLDETGLRALQRLVPDVLGQAPGDRVSANPVGELDALHEAIDLVLRQAASLGPIVVIIEDLHAANADDTEVVLALVEARISGTLIVLTSRIDEAGATSVDHVAEVARSSGSFQRLRLSELALDDVVLIADRVKIDGDPTQLGRAVYRRTGGHPFFVTSLLESIARGGGDQLDRQAVPEDVTTHITHRFDRLPADTREVLQIAAVVGDEFDLDLVARTWCRSVDAVNGLMMEVEGVGLVKAVTGSPGRLRFAHELVRDAVYQRMPTWQRARLHRTVADAMEFRGTGLAGALAHHCYEAARAFPEMRVRSVEASVAAGQDAIRCLAYAAAVELYRRAMDHAQTNEQRARIGAGLGDALWRDGHIAEARRQLDQAVVVARDLHAPKLFAQIVTALSYAAYESSFSDPSLTALYDEALAALPEGEVFWRVRLIAAIGRQTFLRVDHRALPQMADLALQLAAKDDDPATRAYANQVQHNALLSRPGTAERIEVVNEMIASADAAHNPALLCAAYEFRMLAALEDLDLPSIEATITACKGTAERFRYPFAHWLVALYRAGLTLVQRPLDEAELVVEHARQLGESLGYDEVDLMYAIQWAFLRREKGHIEETERFIRGGADTFDVPAWKAALAATLCEMGGAHTQEAVMLLDAFKEHGFQNVVPDGAYGLTLCCLAQAYTHLGDRESACQLLPIIEAARGRQPVLAGSVTYFGSWDYHHGRLHMMLGDHDTAIRCFEAAYPRDQAMKARLWTCHTQVAHVCALRARNLSGDRQAADRLAASAQTTADEYGYIRAERDLANA